MYLPISINKASSMIGTIEKSKKNLKSIKNKPDVMIYVEMDCTVNFLTIFSLFKYLNSIQN